jgi:CheY-like chemotaxis protein
MTLTGNIGLLLADGAPKPRALIVDDDGILRIAIKRSLDDLGFDTELSESGEHACDRIRRGERFALVVTDVQMPGMDGHAFLEAARGLWPEIAAKAVLVSGSITFNGERDDGGVPCFGKPLTSDFYDHVRRVLRSCR